MTWWRRRLPTAYAVPSCKPYWVPPTTTRRPSLTCRQQLPAFATLSLPAERNCIWSGDLTALSRDSVNQQSTTVALVRGPGAESPQTYDRTIAPMPTNDSRGFGAAVRERRGDRIQACSRVLEHAVHAVCIEVIWRKCRKAYVTDGHGDRHPLLNWFLMMRGVLV